MESHTIKFYNPGIPSNFYASVATLVGGSGILGKAVIEGVISQTDKVVTVRLKNVGLAALANSSLSVSVIALKIGQ